MISKYDMLPPKQIAESPRLTDCRPGTDSPIQRDRTNPRIDATKQVGLIIAGKVPKESTLFAHFLLASCSIADTVLPPLCTKARQSKGEKV